MGSSHSTSNIIRRKRALVIGNEQYKKYPIKTSLSDAKQMREALERHEFTVTWSTNCNHQSIINLIFGFLQRTNEDDLILIYFSGHGIEHHGKTYLIPIDSEDALKQERNVAIYCINIQDTLYDHLEKLSHIAILVLELSGQSILTSKFSNDRPANSGIYAMKGPGGNWVRYIESPVTLNPRNNNEKINSLLTKHFLENLEQPNKNLNEFMYSVAYGISRESQTRITQINDNDHLFRKPIYLNDRSSTGSSFLSPILISGQYNIPANGKWSCKSITMIDTLSLYPRSLAVDPENGDIYVADFWKNCVISLIRAKRELRVAVQNLGSPTSVLIDKENESIIIADSDNRRVLRCLIQNENSQVETIIENVDCFGLAMDSEGDLYVSDWKRDEVRKYPKGNQKGIVVAGGNGRGSQLNQLNWPNSIALDSRGSIYVSDCRNNRVIKWKRASKEGIVVAGFQGQGSRTTQLDCPCGVFVDRNRNLYVADKNNHRIVRYRRNSQVSDILIGSNEIKSPYSLSFDRENNLYVSDKSRRVLRFSFLE